jgi:glycosyltransferase involved in cell wall biosynthesis
MRKDRGKTNSVLERIIPPEIKDDELYRLISHLAATENLRYVLEIGSSAGGGSTEAFVNGLARNPGRPNLFCIELSPPRFEILQATYADRPFVKCYNMSTVAVEEFPSAAEVEEFYNAEATNLRNYPLEQVLSWLQADKDFIRSVDRPTNAIDAIKKEYGITNRDFDLCLIDGSEFTGEAELAKVIGARIILLDDTNAFKCFKARQQLLAHPEYELIADNQSLRNGYSAFRRRPAAELQVHFFTIVLNGEPWIRYHEQVLAKLSFNWHWHIIEGVASLSHDTAWSTAAGGRIENDIHRSGRSKDGTSEYLDDLAARFPDNVTVYRLPPGEFWEGKRAMVNAPLPNIREECLLWQIDVDELWTPEQIETIRSRFIAEPTRSAAYYWCWYFVGPDKVISTRYNYAQNPAQEWLRTWRFVPGDHWAAHEPPTLVRPQPSNAPPVNVADINAFRHDETEAFGAVFQHYAYASEEQARFKESYYGYAGAVAQWRALQASKGAGFLADYLSWVTDRTMYDDAAAFGVRQLARWQPQTRQWSFMATDSTEDAAAAQRRPRILLDGIYWQYLNSGIGRVWQNLLEQWVRDGKADHVIVLDRAGTAPRIKGVHYQTIARHDYSRTGHDSLYLERICQQLGADLFVSTYYSTPVETPSFFFGHDMIPEVTGLDLSEEVWQEKARAIRHASGHSMVSVSSMRDLSRLFPMVRQEDVAVTNCGVATAFHPATAGEVASARAALQLPQRYALMVGDRSGAGGYKNGIHAFRAVEAAAARGLMLSLVCVGGMADIEPQLRAAAPSVPILRLGANDADLRLIYAGAHALLYPSRYEGFGLPVAEAMACGCPVITCANSSLIEVGGDAAIFVGPDAVDATADALLQLDDAGFRADRVAKGLAQAARFSTRSQAASAMTAFLDCHAALSAGTRKRPGEGWREFRMYQASIQSVLQQRPDLAAELQTAARATDAVTAAPLMPGGELLRLMAELEAIRNSPFWRLRNKAVRLLRTLRLRHRD